MKKTKSKPNKKGKANERLALKTLAKTVNVEYQAMIRYGRELLERVVACGKALLEAKESLKHGEWETWVTENCEPDLRCCQRYMKLAKNDKISLLQDHHSMNQAFAAISDSLCPVGSAPKQLPEFTTRPVSMADVYCSPKVESDKATVESSSYLDSIGIKSAEPAKPEAPAPKAKAKSKAKATPEPDACEHLRELVSQVMDELARIGDQTCITSALYPIEQWLVCRGKAV